MQLQITASFTPIARDWKRGAEKAAAVALTRTAYKVKDGIEAQKAGADARIRLTNGFWRDLSTT